MCVCGGGGGGGGGEGWAGCQPLSHQHGRENMAQGTLLHLVEELALNPAASHERAWYTLFTHVLDSHFSMKSQ